MIHTFLIKQKTSDDPKAQRLLADAHALGFSELTAIECNDLYFVQGELTDTEQQKLSAELFSDPVSQICTVSDHRDNLATTGNVVEIALRPGVTDPVSEQIMRSAPLLGITSIERVATGQRFTLHSAHPLHKATLEKIAARLLANPVIHYYKFGALDALFPPVSSIPSPVEMIALRELDDQQLLKLSQERRAALDLAEMRAIQNYYRSIKRDPSDVEFETIAQTWSEHCSHKTFKADINFNGETIHGLLNTYIRAATEKINAAWVWSAFVDNAGIIDFDDNYQISFKVETHNHPSAIEPFGGANTGLGGVIRDLLGVSAKPIAATDVFCFGLPNTDLQTLPEGTLHPRLIRSGVVAGVQDYGNKTGIPTVNGAVWYDPGFTANPLVYCGCVGLAPKNKHPRAPQASDRVILIGGRTGRDGLRGATFSSMAMDAQTGAVAGASVQIGDPIIAKGLIEVVTRARDLNLYHAITDCGAGGLSSAVGEMASEIGADVDIIHVKLKYPGLAAWEIWLSEAQERMVLAVPAQNVAQLKTLCETFDLDLTDIGAFTDTDKLIVRYDQKITLQLDNKFLHGGMPKKSLTAVMPVPQSLPAYSSNRNLADIDVNDIFRKLLTHLNIASKEEIIRRYDHEVQGGTVIKPLIGAQNDGPSDACVLKPMEIKSLRGIVLANGLNPEIGKYDPYAMAVSAIDEAIRNAVAVGADPDRIAILDNFCWGDPKRPETLGALVLAARGCYDGALHYRTPFISGKDSLNNEYIGTDGLRHAIPATLLISAIGIIPDVTKAVTMDFKKAGNNIYLLGDTLADFVGSHFVLVGGKLLKTDTVPSLPSLTPKLYRALHQAMQAKLVRACHDLSEGGLAVAIAEMCNAGRLGCELTLPAGDSITELFSESNGRLLVEVETSHCAAFEKCFSSELRDLIHKIGVVIEGQQLTIQQNNQTVVSLRVDKLAKTTQQLL